MIMESSDFKGNNVLPVDLHKLPTEFHIVKSAGSRFVVVMDVSGSMKEFVSLIHQNTNNVHNLYYWNVGNMYRIALANWESPSAPGSKMIYLMEVNWGWLNSGLFYQIKV